MDDYSVFDFLRDGAVLFLVYILWVGIYFMYFTTGLKLLPFDARDARLTWKEEMDWRDD